jgi:hypothetical protein
LTLTQIDENGFGGPPLGDYSRFSRIFLVEINAVNRRDNYFIMMDQIFLLQQKFRVFAN